MVAFTYRMPAGIPGTLTRTEHATVESGIYNPAKPPVAYGRFVKIVSGKVEVIEANDAASVAAGLLVRPYVTQGGQSDPLGTDTVNTSNLADIMKRGYMMVKNYAGTPAKDGQVYMRVANADATHPLGGVEAASSIAVTGAAGGGNTGNGTIGTLSAAAGAVSGAYTVTMLGATTFRVSDPNGNELKNGATGAAYTAGGVTFTITVGATPMVAGDTFTVTVAPNTVPIAGAKFTGPADSSGNTEVAYNI